MAGTRVETLLIDFDQVPPLIGPPARRTSSDSLKRDSETSGFRWNLRPKKNVAKPSRS